MPTKKKQSLHPRSSQRQETDGAYFLKIVLYIILGSLWVKFAHPMHFGEFVLNGAPIGLVIGMVFASHDHFQVDRKIEYVILLIMIIVTYFLPAGIVI
ncbi:hypothetical protein KA093_02705 [Candidatus Saccharibacteria bacterium]|nr:hypothetical protein [Candidatus Saccharibacteria bacterium]